MSEQATQEATKSETQPAISHVDRGFLSGIRITQSGNTRPPEQVSEQPDEELGNTKEDGTQTGDNAGDGNSSQDEPNQEQSTEQRKEDQPEDPDGNPDDPANFVKNALDQFKSGDEKRQEEIAAGIEKQIRSNHQKARDYDAVEATLLGGDADKSAEGFKNLMAMAAEQAGIPIDQFVAKLGFSASEGSGGEDATVESSALEGIDFNEMREASANYASELQLIDLSEKLANQLQAMSKEMAEIKKGGAQGQPEQKQVVEQEAKPKPIEARTVTMLKDSMEQQYPGITESDVKDAVAKYPKYEPRDAVQLFMSQKKPVAERESKGVTITKKGGQTSAPITKKVVMDARGGIDLAASLRG